MKIYKPKPDRVVTDADTDETSPDPSVDSGVTNDFGRAAGAEGEVPGVVGEAARLVQKLLDEDDGDEEAPTEDDMGVPHGKSGPDHGFTKTTGMTAQSPLEGNQSEIVPHAPTQNAGDIPDAYESMKDEHLGSKPPFRKGAKVSHRRHGDGTITRASDGGFCVELKNGRRVNVTAPSNGGWRDKRRSNLESVTGKDLVSSLLSE